jgi:sugar-specific transcriptional regulator TrmB
MSIAGVQCFHARRPFPTAQPTRLYEYEAKAYLALLQQSPLTGYAIARISGVPRSKIYEVLNSLVERGDALISYGEPIQYAQPPHELIESRRLTTERQLAEAEQGLKEFTQQKTPTDLIWDIRGQEEILYRVHEVITRAREQILLQIFAEDVEEIRDDLEAAAQRGVAITIMAYGQLDLPFARIYSHEPGREEILDEYGERWLIVSIDAREIVAGIISQERQPRRLVGPPGHRHAHYRTDQTRPVHRRDAERASRRARSQLRPRFTRFASPVWAAHHCLPPRQGRWGSGNDVNSLRNHGKHAATVVEIKCR